MVGIYRYIIELYVCIGKREPLSTLSTNLKEDHVSVDESNVQCTKPLKSILRGSF